MQREQAKQQIKTYLKEYLQDKGIDTNKPFRCLSPNHEDIHPSMSFNPKANECKCFSCNTRYDIFNLIGQDYKLEDFNSQLSKACELYGITLDNSNYTPKQPKIENITQYITHCKANIDKTDYLNKRGISTPTLKANLIGYDAVKNAVIFPNGIDSYTERYINSDDKGTRYKKHGKQYIFNGNTLQTAEQPIFVCEGEIDALSIIELGGCAVALGSINNTRLLLELLKENKPKQPLILALDQDIEGQKAQEELKIELDKLNILYSSYDIRGKKDINELLIEDKEGLKSDILQANTNALELEEIKKQELINEYNKTSAYYSLKDFINGINERANTPVISTGFKKLDQILDGGLYEGLYILGAISSLGKSTYFLQLADQLAEIGQDIIIFSLEMAKSELISKSISRNTYILSKQQYNDKIMAKTSRGITEGARYINYSDQEKRIIKESMQLYQEIAKHIYIHEGIGDIGVKEIRETIERHIKITGNKPIVIIDYLQILAPYNEHMTDKQNVDKNTTELKRISRDYKIPVLVISSLNRDSYRTKSVNKGEVSTADFKESGGIEYSVDVLIGLQFASAGTSSYKESDEKLKDPREIKLVILKNRNGKAWQTINYKYFPMFNYFIEDKTIYK